MKLFVRYIVDIIVSLLKRTWYHAKMKLLKEELAKEKEEADEAITDANDAVSDFERAFGVFDRSKGENQLSNSSDGDDNGGDA